MSETPTEAESGRPARTAHRRRQAAGSTSVLVAVAGAGLCSAGSVLDNPTAALVGLTAAGAALLRRRLPWDLGVVASALGLVALATLLGLAAAALGLDLFTAPALARGAVATAAVLAAVRVVARPAHQEQPRGTWQLLAWLPAGVAVVVGLAQGASTTLAASWSFVGTDVSLRMLELRQLQEAGHLSYADATYPRALHMLVALVGGGGPASAPDLLVYDLRLVAAWSWLGLAVLLVGASSMTLRLAGAVGREGRTAAVVAAALGLVLLTANPFLDAFLYMGAGPSMLAVVVLWVLPLAVLSRPDIDSRVVVVLTGASVFLVAHLWQALLPVPLVTLLAVLTARRGRDLGLLVRRGKRACAVSAALAAAAAPAVLGVLDAGGTSLAGLPGEIVRPPLWTCAVAVAGLAALRWRTPLCRAVHLGTAGGLLVSATVLALGAGEGLVLTAYYPQKALWFLCLSLVPVAAVGVAVAGERVVGVLQQWLGRLGTAAPAGRLLTAAAALALFVAVGLPQLVAVPSSALGAVRASWDAEAATLGLERIAIARTHANAHGDSVPVPVALGRSLVFDEYGTYIISNLMSFMNGHPNNHGRAHSVCIEAERVAGDAAAVVVTKLDPAQLRPFMLSGGCDGLPVVQVPGEIADTVFLKALSP